MVYAAVFGIVDGDGDGGYGGDVGVDDVDVHCMCDVGVGCCYVGIGGNDGVGGVFDTCEGYVDMCDMCYGWRCCNRCMLCYVVC